MTGSRSDVGASPLFIFATSDGERVDISLSRHPIRQSHDEQHIAFGDLAGNNRIDHRTKPPAAVIDCHVVHIPGLEETMRVNGSSISTDCEIRNLTEQTGAEPRDHRQRQNLFQALGKGTATINMWISPAVQMSDRYCRASGRHIDEAEHVDAIATSLEEATRQLCGNRVEVRNFSPLHLLLRDPNISHCLFA